MNGSFVDSARKLRIAVIGDIMLDTYVDGTVERLSPEAPNSLILDETGRRYAIGGAANVAHNLAHFGVKTRLCGTLGTMDNEFYRMVLASQLKQLGEKPTEAGGSLDFYEVVETTSSRMCTVKTRYRSENQQLLRVDREHRHPLVLDSRGGEAIKDVIRCAIDGADVVILSDYGKGMLSNSVLTFLLNLLFEKGSLYMVDPKRTRFADYLGPGWPGVICPNAKEWRACEEYVNKDAKTIHSIPHVVVTAGARGCFEVTWDDTLGHWVEKYHSLHHEVPVADTAGAGDTFIAALAVALMGTEHDKIVKKEIGEACQIANCLASLTVSKPGVSLPDMEEAQLLIDRELQRASV